MSVAASTPTETHPNVRVDRRDAVVHLELHNPARRNALSRPMLRELVHELGRLQPESTAGVVLTGAGGCFSAGADFREITGTSADTDFDDHVNAAAQAVSSLPVPVIGVVTGPCMGAANEVALACDVLVAEPAAVFQVPAVKLGLLYNPVAIAKLRSKLSDQTVRRMLVLAERFTAADALEAGLVATVQPKGHGVGWAVDRLMGSWDKAGVEARSATKELLNAVRGEDFDMDAWQRVREELLDSEVRRKRVKEAKARYRA